MIWRRNEGKEIEGGKRGKEEKAKEGGVDEAEGRKDTER